MSGCTSHGHSFDEYGRCFECDAPMLNVVGPAQDILDGFTNELDKLPNPTDYYAVNARKLYKLKKALKCTKPK